MNRTKLIILLVAIGFAARVAVTLAIGDNHRPYYEYMAIAQNLLDGKGYSWNEWGLAPMQPTSFLPPIYVYWCTFFIWLQPSDFTLMYILQALIAASGCVPAYHVGRRLFSEETGVAFATLYTVYPELVFLHSRPVTEFLYVVLALWLIYLYIVIRDGGSVSRSVWKTALITGALGAFTILVKESTTILIFALVAALLIHTGIKWRAASRIYLPMLIGGVIVMSPWIIRNYVVQHQLILVRTGYGLTAWIANHPGATGTDKTADGTYVMSHLDPSLKARMDSLLPTDEQDRDQVYRREVWSFIKEHSAQYASLTAKRLVYFVWFDPTHPLGHNLIYRFGYVLLLLSGIPGIVLAVKRHKLDPIIWIGMLGYLALYVPVLVLPRYRIIPVVLLLLMSSTLISELFDKCAQNRPTG